MKKIFILCLLATVYFSNAQTTTTTLTTPWPNEGPQPDREIYTYNMTNEHQFVLNWEISVPYNEPFLTKTGLSGLRLDYKYFLEENFALGASVGWNSHNQYVNKQLYQEPDGSSAVYTDMVRHIYNVPIALNGYYFFYRQNIKPYVGLGLGTQYSEQTSYFNIYGIRDSNWGFLVKPEVGLQAEINSHFGLASYVSYNYATNKNNSFNLNELKSLNIGIGIYWEW